MSCSPCLGSLGCLKIPEKIKISLLYFWKFPNLSLLIVGTFSTNAGNNELADCINCTAGMYCQGDGNIVPDDWCTQGYYCPTGIDTPTPADHLCYKGHYCPTGSDYPLICTNGTYQAMEAMPTCDPCPQGYYCDPVESKYFCNMQYVYFFVMFV